MLTLVTGLQARTLIETGYGRDDLPAALPPGAARNAIDCALWDLEAKLSGRDVAEMIGGARPRPVASAITVTIDTPGAMAEAAAALADAPVLKVKVDALDPEAQVRAVRDAAPIAHLSRKDIQGQERG